MAGRFGRCSPRWSPRSTTTARSTSTPRSRSARWLEANGNDGLVDRRHDRRGAHAHRRGAARAARRGDRGGDHPGRRGHRHERHAPRHRADRQGVGARRRRRASSSRRTTTARPRRGSRRTSRRLPPRRPCPVILYDIPIRTGRKVATDMLLRLAATCRTSSRVKDAAGNPAETAVLLAGRRAGFEVYSGDDAFTLPLLAVGAVGCDRRRDPLVGRRARRDDLRVREGRRGRGRETNARLLESYAFETSDDTPNPIPTKAMMRVLGHAVGQCRPPLGPAPAGTEERARQVLDNLRRVRRRRQPASRG